MSFRAQGSATDPRRIVGRMHDAPDQPTEPEQAPPWRPEDGPPPRMRVWASGERPALEVLINGEWQYAVVDGRADYADGRVAYHVAVKVVGNGSGSRRAYWWPQEGLRVAHGPDGR